MKKINLFKKITTFTRLLLIFSLIFVFSFNRNNVNAVESVNESPEIKTYYEGSVEDEFSDDKVIIVLTKEATRRFLTYTPDDFPEIDCVSVQDLTNNTVDYVRKKVNNEKLKKQC